MVLVIHCHWSKLLVSLKQATSFKKYIIFNYAHSVHSHSRHIFHFKEYQFQVYYAAELVFLAVAFEHCWPQATAPRMRGYKTLTEVPKDVLWCTWGLSNNLLSVMWVRKGLQEKNATIVHWQRIMAMTIKHTGKQKLQYCPLHTQKNNSLEPLNNSHKNDKT